MVEVNPKNMNLNKNLGNIPNHLNNGESIKPPLPKLENKGQKTVSSMHISFELFKKKLIESEKNLNKMPVEDTANTGSSFLSNEKLQYNEDPIKQVSNDVKIMWLQSALYFIKNDQQTTLKFPTISVNETDFIEAILNQNCEPELDGRFTALYLSIKEALAIYKMKFIFALNTVCKSKTTIKLELEKTPKSNKLKFVKKPRKKKEAKLSETKIKRRAKMVNDKMDILNAVPMHYVINCYTQILEFLDDDLRFSIKFEKLTNIEYSFMVNIKQIVKSRELLDGLPEELITLLDRISEHKEHVFSLFPNRSKHEQKYITITKVPKGGVKGKFHTTQDRTKTTTSRPYYNILDTLDFEKQATELNNNKVLYRKIDNTIKNTSESNSSNLNHNCVEDKQIGKEFTKNIFKSNNPYAVQTKSDRRKTQRANSLTSCYADVKSGSSSDLNETICDAWENVDISHWQPPTEAESLATCNEQKLANQSKSIQFQRGGSVDMLNEEHSSNIKQNNVRGRSWSRDREMKSKMYEALSVPLKSTKAMRMMQLMGWKGGALGSRGEGITEPIMPAIGIQPGAGLGHGSNHFKTNVIATKDPQPVPLVQPEKVPSKDKSKAKKRRQNNTVTEGEETRLKILSKILEFMNSSEGKMVLYFNEILQEEDTRFVICSIDQFNRRKYVRNLKSKYGADDLRKVQEAMLFEPHVNLAAEITEDKKEIVLTKTFKGENNNEIGIDFAIDSNDSIRLNISVFRYIKSMKPRQMYGIFSKSSYQLLGFKLLMLEEILKFLDEKQSTLMLYIDIKLNDKHTDYLQNFIDVVNMERKPRYPTEAEEILVEKIYNKIGDYCLILDCFTPLKIIKLQKRNRSTQDSGVCESNNNELGTNELKQTEVKDVLTEKQNNDNLNQINSLEFDIEKTVEKITTRVINNISHMYGNNYNNTVSEEASVTQETVKPNNLSKTIEEVMNVEQDIDEITTDLTEENSSEVEQIEKTPKQNLEDNQEVIETDNIEVLQEIEEKDLSAESEDILKIINDLEQSIRIEEKDLDEELNHKRNRSDSNDSQLQDTKKMKHHSIKVYKQIEITPNNAIETMNTNLAGIVQSLISNAIDKTVSLPLLQCNGIVNDKLLYICYNENTYKWIKTVLKDQFLVLDTDLHLEGRRKLKIHLKTYIYDDTTKILNRIKLYNSYLDVDNWKIHKTFVSVESTLIWIEVDEEDYGFISQSAFSLFAGIDKATFSVTWD